MSTKGRLLDILASGRAPGVCPRGEPPQNVEVLQGFKKLEEKLGASTIERGMKMKASTIKRVWERD